MSRKVTRIQPSDTHGPGTIMKGLLLIGVAAVVTLGTSLTASSSPPKAGLTISPTYVSVSGDGPGGCTTEGTVWVCHVTLTNTSAAKWYWESIGTNDWSNGIDGAYYVVNPSSGTLAPGKSVKVFITTNQCGGYFDLGMFLGGPNFDYGSAVMYACG